ncbi:lysophospholipase [bacterium]|nr:lysophospholipase [bacterium]
MADPEALLPDDSFPISLGGWGAVKADDGYNLRYRRYRPTTESKGAIVCLHGIQSHAGWYDESSRFLASQGFDLFFPDRRGSGMNTVDRGYCRSPGQLVGDVKSIVDHVREEVPSRPVYMIAISWGGKLALASLMKNHQLVDGLVLVCPGFFAQVGPTFRERMMIGGSFLFWPKRPIRVPLTDPYLFTETPRWQEYLRDDPRLLRIATARLLMSSVFLDRMIRKAGRRVLVPTITFLAGQDRIIDNAKVRRFIDQFATWDKRVVEYPLAHHTLEFEPDPRPFFRDLADWLGERTARWQASNNSPTRRIG